MRDECCNMSIQKFVDGFCGVHSCVHATTVMEEQYFRHFVGGTNPMKVSIQSS